MILGIYLCWPTNFNYPLVMYQRVSLEHRNGLFS